MYINYLQDRKNLGYLVIKDQVCGNQLVRISDSIVLVIKDCSLHLIEKDRPIIFKPGTLIVLV